MRLLAAVLLALAQTPAPKPDIALIQAGVFQAEDLNASTGRRWLALVQTPQGYAWEFRQIEIRPAQNECVDEPGQKTAREVVAPGTEPLFLSRGLDELASKRVQVVSSRVESFSSPGSGVAPLAMAKGAYTLRMNDRRLEDNDPPRRSTLTLTSGDVTQVLYEWPAGFFDQHCELLWAGDLDGDGKLDLYVDISDHYNIMEPTLFLSSHRQLREIVHKVASFRIVGC